MNKLRAIKCKETKLRICYLQFDHINLRYDKCKGEKYHSNSPVDKIMETLNYKIIIELLSM